MIYSDFNNKHVFTIEIRNNILIQCHEIYIGVNEINCEFENDILRNNSQKIWCLEG